MIINFLGVRLVSINPENSSGLRALKNTLINIYMIFSMPVSSDRCVFIFNRLTLEIEGVLTNPAECSYKDNSDGTVSDEDNDLQWSIRDSRQELGKWLNWDESEAYVKACNEQSYLGHNDWRLPTKSEIRGLFKNKGVYQKIFLNSAQKKERKVSNYQAGGEFS